MPRKYRTTVPGSPRKSLPYKNGNAKENGNDGREKDTSMGNLLTRQALKSYEAPCHIIKYKYGAYSGTLAELPRFA